MKPFDRLDRVIRQALVEDRARQDITTAAVLKKTQTAQAVILCQQEAVVCGIEIAKRVFKILNPHLQIRALVQDGQKIKKNQKVLIIQGRARALLSGERVALNFLSYLSAIATKTNRFVERIKPSKTYILDTRKTTPTLRFLERYAVRCGGGHNHRDDLAQMMLIKDNHLVAAGGLVKEVIECALNKAGVSVEVEVDNLAQLQDAFQTSADIILLDNMTPAAVKKAVTMRNNLKKSVLLEASGGIKLANVRRYAQTGVDRISIGELTHSREAVDFSMEIKTC